MLIGEVSTVNDDLTGNILVAKGRSCQINEGNPPSYLLNRVHGSLAGIEAPMMMRQRIRGIWPNLRVVMPAPTGSITQKRTMQTSRLWSPPRDVPGPQLSAVPNCGAF